MEQSRFLDCYTVGYLTVLESIHKLLIKAHFLGNLGNFCFGEYTVFANVHELPDCTVPTLDNMPGEFDAKPTDAFPGDRNGADT